MQKGLDKVMVGNDTCNIAAAEAEAAQQMTNSSSSSSSK